MEDDGKGIPEEIRNKLFTRQSKRDGSNGLGIGTYLIKRIAENYGGSVIFIDSELSGSRFDVILNKV